jgi:hypothetical protein
MKVRVYTDYDPVRILIGANREPDDAMAFKSGLVGSFVEVDRLELPQDRTYRNAWEVKSGKVEINAAKKKNIDDVIAKKEADVLIAEKVKELAIAELKIEGKLDANGKVIK